MKTISLLLSSIGIALIAPPAHAAYVINIVESGANVVATGSGSLNINGLTLHTNYSLPGYMTPSGGNFLSGSAGAYSVFRTINPGLPFGSGNTAFVTLSVGSQVGILGNQYILVPQNYLSGSDLGTTITTFANKSFANLGLTTSSYVWTWGSGQNADSLTINVGMMAVPEPMSWSMMVLGFGVVGYGMRRRASNKAPLSYKGA